MAIRSGSARPIGVVVAVVGGIAAISVVGAGLFIAHRRTTAPNPLATPSSSQVATSIAPPAPMAPPSIASASAAPSAEASPDAGAASHSKPKAFDPTSAQGALDAIAPELVECKVSKGATVRVRVTFASDGKVSSAVTLAPYSGRPAACIATHVRKAQIRSFRGPPSTKVYVLTVPR